MKKLDYTGPETISDLHKNMAVHGTNPRAVIRDVFGMLNRVTNGQVDIVDASNPFVYAVESAVALTSGFFLEDHSLNRRQYPASAQTEDDLYYHMSDLDYLKRFAIPSRGQFVFIFNYQEILAKMVDVPSLGIRKVVIPRHTSVSVGSVLFKLEYPIEIRELRHGGIQVIYDTAITSPLDTLTSNIIDAKIASNAGIECLFFSIPMNQYNVIYDNMAVNESTKISYSKTLTDQFYTCRVYTYSEGMDNEVELATTFSPSVYDIEKPTALLKLVGKTLTITIPQIYYGRGLLKGRLRFEIYETIGELKLNLGSYSINEFEVDFSDGKEKKSSIYNAPLNSLSLAQCSSDPVDTITTGGRDELTFEALRERVINNVTGQNVIPVSNIAIESNLIDKGFEIVKNIDVVTNRTYLATKALPDPTQTKLITAASASMEGIFLNIDEAAVHSTSYDNGLRLTLSPDTIYKSSNGRLEIVPPSRIDQLRAMSAEARVIEVNRNNYYYTPFHYVLDAANNEFSLRAYYLDKPVIKSKSFVEENGSTLIGATIDSYDVTRSSNGYTVSVVINADDSFAAFADDEVFAQMSFIPPGEKDYAYLNGKFVGSVQKQRVFEFEIDTRFDADKNDQLVLTSFLMYDTDPKTIPVNLNTSFDITIGVVGDAGPQWLQNDLDRRMGWFTLNGSSKAVVCERIDVLFGYALTNLWRRARTFTSPEIYQTHLKDVPLLYKEDVYDKTDINTTVSVVNGKVVYTATHKKGDPVKNAAGEPIFLAKKGDVVLDENGKAVLKEPRGLSRYMDLMLIEAAYWFADDMAAVTYRQEITDTFVDWIVDALGSSDDYLLEQTSIYFYPKSTLGYIDVMYNSNIFSKIEAAQSLNITLMVSKNVSRDTDLQEKIKETTIRVVNNALKEKTVSNSGIYSKLEEAYTGDVLGLTMTGLGSNENIIMFSVIDDKKQCTVRKRLYLQNDGHIGVEEDVTINFVVHDVNTKNAYV